MWITCLSNQLDRWISKQEVRSTPRKSIFIWYKVFLHMLRDDKYPLSGHLLKALMRLECGAKAMKASLEEVLYAHVNVVAIAHWSKLPHLANISTRMFATKRSD